MFKRRIKFIWGASKIIRGRWWIGLIGFYDRHEGVREDGLAISVRGLLLWGLVAAAAGWVVLASVGFWIWQQNPYSTLAYSDAVCYPLRRVEIARKQGMADLAQGRELARQGRWEDASDRLRRGLSRVPDDLNSRQLLAQFYEATNQHVFAIKTLAEGLGAGYPGRNYLDAMFRLASKGEDFGVIASTCRRMLPLVNAAPRAADQRWLRERCHAALTAAGRHSEALALAEAEPASEGREERRTLSLLGLGRTSDALAVLQEWRQRPGASLATVLRLETRAFRESKQYGGMERALAELRKAAPGEPGPLVFAVVQEVMAGRSAEAATLLRDFLFRYGGYAENLAMAAAALAEVGDLTLVDECLQAARERGFPRARIENARLDALLANGEWLAAGRLLAQLPPPVENTPTDQAWRSWMEALVEAAQHPGEAPQAALVEVLRGRPREVGAFRRSAEVLVRAGRMATARDVLEIGARTYPASSDLQSRLAKVREALKASGVANTLAVPEVRPRAASKSVGPVPVPKMEKKGNAPAAGSPPDLFAQLNSCRAADDQPGMLRVAREYLTGERERAERAVGLVREWWAAGDRRSADLLLREILRRHEGFPPARRLQAEWEAAKTATK